MPRSRRAAPAVPLGSVGPVLPLLAPDHARVAVEERLAAILGRQAKQVRHLPGPRLEVGDPELHLVVVPHAWLSLVVRREGACADVMAALTEWRRACGWRPL